MTVYTPDSYVMIRMTHKNQVFYKVLGGWSGGYLDGTSWRLNSGVTKAEYNEETERWEFHGSSGSVYHCHKDTYGLTLATMGIWNQMLEKYPAQVQIVEEQNWKEKDWSI